MTTLDKLAQKIAEQATLKFNHSFTFEHVKVECTFYIDRNTRKPTHCFLAQIGNISVSGSTVENSLQALLEQIQDLGASQASQVRGVT